jgi:hypothetical protein
MEGNGFSQFDCSHTVCESVVTDSVLRVKLKLLQQIMTLFNLFMYCFEVVCHLGCSEVTMML